MSDSQSLTEVKSSQAGETVSPAPSTESHPFTPGRIVDEFHRRYYQGDPASDSPRGLHTDTYFHGIETHKCPLDLWIYQEILFETRPTLVVELGTYLGGTTLFLAHQLEALGRGTVLSIDNCELPRPEHARIQYLLGDSHAPETVSAAEKLVDVSSGPLLVIHDADHHFGAVLPDLENFAPFVTPGSYLIVEDTNVNGHPVLPEWGPGPREAVESFLTDHPEFERDNSREKFLLTYNPGGYLRRTR